MNGRPSDHYPTGPPLGWGPVVVVTATQRERQANDQRDNTERQNRSVNQNSRLRDPSVGGVRTVPGFLT